MRWTDGPQRWARVLELLRRLEALIASLPRDGVIDDEEYARVVMRAVDLRHAIVTETERAQRELVDQAIRALSTPR
jgi:hypothetical protein